MAIDDHGTTWADDISASVRTEGGVELLIGNHKFDLTRSAALVLASKLMREIVEDDS